MHQFIHLFIYFCINLLLLDFSFPRCLTCSMLFTRITYPIWIAYTDQSSEGSYVDSGTGLYPWWTNFKGNQPDGAILENCAARNHTGEWVDVDCSNRIHYVCEKTASKIAYHSQNETFNQCLLNVGMTSQTMSQHYANIG